MFFSSNRFLKKRKKEKLYIYIYIYMCVCVCLCVCVILISQWLNEDERALLVLTPLAVFGHQDSNPTNLTPLIFTKGTKKKKK